MHRATQNSRLAVLLPNKTAPSHPTPLARLLTSHGGHGGVGVAAAAEGGGARVHAEHVPRRGRAPELPRLPPLAVRRPLGRAAGRGVVGGLPPPRRRGAVGAAPRRPGLVLRGAALRRAGAAVAHPGGLPLVPLPLRAPPRRPPPPPLPRPPPPRLRGRLRRIQGAARPLLPPARLLRRPLLPRRGGLQDLLVLRRRALRLRLVVVRRRLRARGPLLGLPRRRLLHGLRPLPGHLLPPDPADGGVRARVRQVRRRRHRARAPPPDQGPAPADQPQVPPVHPLLPRARHRQPVRRAARHHQAARRHKSRHRGGARPVLAHPRRRAADVPVQRGQDHAQDAGDHERGRRLARRRHHPRLRQRPGGSQPGAAGRRRLPGARERLPGRRRRGDRLRRHLQRGLNRRLQVHTVPDQQHLLPKETGTGDIHGEQPGRHHGVWLRRRPFLAARPVHDRVLTHDVVAGEDGWYILKACGCAKLQALSSFDAASDLPTMDL